MRGYKVEAVRLGHHGLPAELEVQRQLGITDKARSSRWASGRSMTPAGIRCSGHQQWRAYVTPPGPMGGLRQRLQDLDLSFMGRSSGRSNNCGTKGLAYHKGVRVLPYCWNDETPLSNHELRMDIDVYQSRQDPAITVGFGSTHRGPVWTAPIF